jgi:hypothetical protein
MFEIEIAENGRPASLRYPRSASSRDISRSERPLRLTDRSPEATAVEALLPGRPAAGPSAAAHWGLASHSAARSTDRTPGPAPAAARPKSQDAASRSCMTTQAEDIFDDFLKCQSEKELAWRCRPRVYLVELENSECTAKLAQMLGSARFASFKELLAAYDKKPSIENYLKLRRDFPEVEIGVERFGGIDHFVALKPELVKYGIDPALIYGVLDVFEPDIDEFSLQLMKSLVAKSKIPKNRPGYINERRAAIPEAFVDYLIAIMLEAMGGKDEPISIPPSLVVLIRERLCGEAPDLHKEYLSRDRIDPFTMLSATGKLLPVREFAARHKISKSAAARWLKDFTSTRRAEHNKTVMKSEDFRQLPEQQRAAVVAALTDPEATLKFVRQRFAEAKNEAALLDTWPTHVEPIADHLFYPDYVRCRDMFERRKLQIAAKS